MAAEFEDVLTNQPVVIDNVSTLAWFTDDSDSHGLGFGDD